MQRTLNIQTGGSLAVVGAFVASEGAAWLLDAYPSSSVAWRLNVGVFRVFENARVDMLPSRFLFGPSIPPDRPCSSRADPRRAKTAIRVRRGSVRQPQLRRLAHARLCGDPGSGDQRGGVTHGDRSRSSHRPATRRRAAGRFVHRIRRQSLVVCPGHPAAEAPPLRA